MNADEVYEVVRKTVADTFNSPIEDIDRDTVAEDVRGWDSLSHTILMVRLQNILSINIPEQVAAEAATVGDLADRLAKLV